MVSLTLLSEQTYRATVPVNHPQMGVDPSKLAVDYPDHVRRYGGVLRYTKGTPEGKGGEIVAHLRDVGSNGQKLGLPSGGGKLLTTLSGVGAAASVANLAVSAVGFYYMNKKLNQLRSEMESLHQEIDQLNRNIQAGFQRVERRLVNIEYMLKGVEEGQEQILEGLEDIKDQLDAAQLSKVLTVIERMKEYEQSGREPTADRVEEWRDTLANVRNRLQILINQWCRGDKPVRSAGFARGTGYYQMWVMTLALEARILRAVDRTERAANLITEKLDDWYMDAARDTVDLLLDDQPGKLLSGPFQNRVTSEHYIDLLEFRRGREFGAEKIQTALGNADLAETELFGSSPAERAKRMKEYDPTPEYSSAVQAYKLVELGRRLDTMALEYQGCARRGLGVDEWERADAIEGERDELYLIPAST